MQSQSTPRDAYATITARIIESLEAGNVPWRRPWNARERGALRNGKSGHAYRGINVPVLALTADAAGYSDPRWLTFKQARDMGGHVRKGEHGTPVVFWQWIERDAADADGESERRRIPFLRVYTVFNVQQCADLALAPLEAASGAPVDAIEAAECIVAGFGDAPPIAHDGGARAYYRPATDSVHMPAREAFGSAQGYYGVLFHELTHATGHPSRLNRRDLDTPAPFGSETYSREELAAEMGSALLLGEAGISDAPAITNSAAYIRSWLAALRADKRLVVVAAAQGQRAADYILGRAVEPASGR